MMFAKIWHEKQLTTICLPRVQFREVPSAAVVLACLVWCVSLQKEV